MFWLILLGTVAATEAIAWFTHRYLLHGPLWFLHRSHHVPHRHAWEWNDLFILVYAVPSGICTYWGLQTHDVPLTAIGLGIAAYGVLYFLVHDVLIHRRVKVWRQANGWYLRALVRGHKVHHKHLQRQQAEVFGFLWVPVRFFRSERNRVAR
jgi:beta-carotene 3-hydroxylase